MRYLHKKRQQKGHLGNAKLTCPSLASVIGLAQPSRSIPESAKESAAESLSSLWVYEIAAKWT